jgi:Ion channel
LLLKVVSVILGALLIASALNDASRTLVTTRRGNRRFTASQIFYRNTWRLWQSIGTRVKDQNRRQTLLGSFGPLSLVGLLVMWVSVLVVGWAFVWWGVRAELEGGVDNLLDAIYYSGVTFFTLGYGDIVPIGGPERLLAVVEAFLGLGIVALVIGFLPTLYGAYSRREVQLLMLDDLTERATPVGLIELAYRRGGLDQLYRVFAEWEHWCADVFDSHTAYPMLMLFRSRQPGQSWLTALGVVTEAAAQTIAIVPDAGYGEAVSLYRRAVRTLDALSVLGADTRPGKMLLELPDVTDDEAAFRAGYDRLVALGFPARPYAEAWADLKALRRGYETLLRSFATVLLIEPEFLTNAPPLPDRMQGGARGAG